MSERKEVWATAPRGENKKDWWIRVGTAFVNRDGSWTLMLDALPTNGRLIVRDERDDRDERPREERQRRDDRGDRPPSPRQRRAAPPPREENSDYAGGGDDIPF